MITGDKVLELLDQYEKNGRDLIRYICDGLQAFDINQNAVRMDWIITKEFENVIKNEASSYLVNPEYRLNGGEVENLLFIQNLNIDEIEQMFSCRDFRNELPGLFLVFAGNAITSWKSISLDCSSFESIRDSACFRDDMDIIAKGVLCYYYERNDLLKFIEAESPIPPKKKKSQNTQSATEIIESVRKSGRKYYKAKEAAAIMGVSQSMIYKLTSGLGELDYNKVGSAIRIPIQALDEYIEKSKGDPLDVKELMALEDC